MSKAVSIHISRGVPQNYSLMMFVKWWSPVQRNEPLWIAKIELGEVALLLVLARLHPGIYPRASSN